MLFSLPPAPVWLFCLCLGSGSGSSRNSDRPFDKNATAAQGHRNQPGIDARRNKRAGPLKLPALAIDPVTVPSVNGAAVSIEGSRSTP